MGKPAIRFYTEGEERRVMNFSPIGDKVAQALLEDMADATQSVVRNVERYANASHHSLGVVVLVLDEQALRDEARARGVAVHP